MLPNSSLIVECEYPQTDYHRYRQDSGGGNSMISHLHGKMPHRQIVMEQVVKYLNGDYS